VLSLVLAVVFLVDMVELVRRFSDKPGFGTLLGVRLAAMRAPALLEDILPFAFLFGAILSLLSLSRRLELIVARAAGVSVWGFLAAPVTLAVGVGVLTAFIGNPLVTRLKADADRIEARLAGLEDARPGKDIWFRQQGLDGPSIMHAAQIDEASLTAFAATAYVFEPDGGFREKVQAPLASFSDGRWVLRNATVASSQGAPRTFEEYVLPTRLTAEELRRIAARPEALSIWSLRGVIMTAQRSGLDTDRFHLAFHNLLARPFFLAAMVAIAASVSLRLTRHGGSGRLVLTGVGLGFLLYVLTKVMGDLGGNGIISPALAAWAPSIIALTFGATVLLREEDG
jgi:lipopolysaccharide export system permease protein